MNEQGEKSKKTRTSKREMHSRKGPVPKNPEPSLWSQLPATAVTSIYKYLGDVDRVAMARVCKSWNQVSKAPALWRSRLFVFGRVRTTVKDEDTLKAKEALNKLLGTLPKCQGKYCTRFTQRFTTALQHVTICFIFSEVADEEIAKDFKSFSASLENAKLRSIKLSGLELGHFKRKLRVDIIASLKRLLRNQPSLRKFEVESPYLTLGSYQHFLTCLPEATAATIEELILSDFLDDRVSLFRKKRELEELKNFSGLSSVNLDYYLISEGLFTAWTKGCPNLSFIELRLDRAWQCTYTPSCEAWESLVNTHPNLLVELTVFDAASGNQMLDILSSGIPMFKLDWNTPLINIHLPELTKVLHRIASYHRTIKHFLLNIAGPFPSLDTTSVQNIFSRCTNLLPLTCENVSDPETGENALTILQSTPWLEKFYY